MAAMSNYLENKLVDHLLRGTPYNAPTSLYVALYTSPTTDAGAGNEITINSNGYIRAPYTASTTTWTNTQASGTGASEGNTGVTANVSVITFQSPTGSWGTVTHFGILDAASGGNLLFHGSLSIPQTVNSGNTVSFSAGALQITFA